MKNHRRTLLSGRNQNLLTQAKIPRQRKVADTYSNFPALSKVSELPEYEARPDAFQQCHQLEKAAIVLEVQERERNAIGMELHDNVNQILVSTKLLLSAVQPVVPGDEELLVTCLNNLQKAIDENRRIAHEMVAPDFKDQKLTEQIVSMAHTMLPGTGTEVQVDYSGLDEKMLQPQQKLAIYRIAQEQCTNIIRHAKAKKVKITLGTNDDKFYMKIIDDGKGVEPNKKSNGIGLQNIKSRITLLHGSSHIFSEPGRGFILEIEMPLEA